MKLFWILISFSILMMPALAMAQPAEVTRTTVPFSFYAGQRLMPAGTYVARAADDLRVLTIEPTDGNAGVMVSELPSETASVLSPAMRFDKVGKVYFLREVSNTDQQFDLGKTNMEKELRNERRLALKKVVPSTPSGI